jgi:hypothetical protein
MPKLPIVELKKRPNQIQQFFAIVEKSASNSPHSAFSALMPDSANQPVSLMTLSQY